MENLTKKSLAGLVWLQTVTESLECEPRRWKVVEHVREKFSCREGITEPPAPSHPIARGLSVAQIRRQRSSITPAA